MTELGGRGWEWPKIVLINASANTPVLSLVASVDSAGFARVILTLLMMTIVELCGS